MKSVYNYFKYQQVDVQCTCENIPVVDMNLAAKISINRSHNGELIVIGINLQRWQIVIIHIKIILVMKFKVEKV